MKANGATNKKQKNKIIHLKLTIYIITQITNENDIYVQENQFLSF